ncbi:MAG: hypothetical protein A2666_04145 [Parcubacteria group bacterium RIFCSPHIGHO2_01_FULL_47_10b]|nr:MAG: hypothetical protein A2666_04145 [Parcubacteria group bacterium RIFCSPHIGHO2_01_FULL_47_10b]
MAMAIIHGLVGPKVNPNGVADGQQVNIPAPLVYAKERRMLVVCASYRIEVRCIGRKRWKIRASVLRARLRVHRGRSCLQEQTHMSNGPRKTSKHNTQVTVPQNRNRWTGRVDQGERVKAG